MFTQLVLFHCLVISYHVLFFLAAIRSVVLSARKKWFKNSIFCYCAVAALTWTVW